MFIKFSEGLNSLKEDVDANWIFTTGLIFSSHLHNFRPLIRKHKLLFLGLNPLIAPSNF